MQLTTAFLERRLPYTEIAAVIGKTMECHSTRVVESLETVMKADQWAREKAGFAVNEMCIAV